MPTFSLLMWSVPSGLCMPVGLQGVGIFLTCFRAHCQFNLPDLLGCAAPHNYVLYCHWPNVLAIPSLPQPVLLSLSLCPLIISVSKQALNSKFLARKFPFNFDVFFLDMPCTICCGHGDADLDTWGKVAPFASSFGIQCIRRQGLLFQLWYQAFKVGSVED